MFRHAIVRPPGATYAQGLTSSGEGAPDLARALEQHRLYCEALESCGLSLHPAPTDDACPDGTFVEDTAVIAGQMAVITRPGAPSRQGETASIVPVLRQFDLEMNEIVAPGTVDGGDVAQVEDHFYIGISQRTNAQGAEQLERIVRRHGYSASAIDIRASRTLLHLKSGLSSLGDGYLIVTRELIDHPELKRYALLETPAEEDYAANCVRVNERVLLAAGYARVAAMLEGVGYKTLALTMSEFRKMDGGLSCLSLRF